MATFGGFQVGPFQPLPAYQQGAAVIIEPPPSVPEGEGGAWARNAARKRREDALFLMDIGKAAVEQIVKDFIKRSR